MRSVNKQGKLLISLLLLALSVQAQTVFHAAVSKTRVGEKEYVQAEFVLENAEKAEQFNAPQFEGFRVVNSTTPVGYTTTGGSRKKYFAFIYTLEPQQTGVFTIGSASVKADDQRLTTQPIQVRISEQPVAADSRGMLTVLLTPKESSWGSSALTTKEFVLEKGELAGNKISKQVFVKLETSSRSVFPGEPVLATYKLYTRLLTEARITQRPTFNGFSVHEMAEENALPAATETIHGKEYRVYVIRRVQLFPLQTGTMTAEQARVQCLVRLIKAESIKKWNISDRKLLPGYYFNQLPPEAIYTLDTVLTCEPVSIEVKPFPADPPAAGPVQATGQFLMETSVSSDTIVSGETGVFRIVVRGKGNFPSINPFVLQWPDGVEGFEPTVKENYSTAVFPLCGEKLFEYRFVARESGMLRLPKVNFVWFDPTGVQYHAAVSAPDSVYVLPPHHQPINEPAAAENKSAMVKEAPSPKAIWVFYLVLAGLMLYWLRGSFRSRKKKPSTSQSVVSLEDKILAFDQQQNKTTSVPQSQLHQTEQVIGLSSSVFFKTFRQELEDFCLQQFEINISLLPRKQAKEKLLEAGKPDEWLSRFFDLLDLCDAALFSPVEMEISRVALLAQAREIITHLS